jgi:zinc transporter
VDDILDLFRNPINTTSSDLDDLEDALLLKKTKRDDELLASLRQRLLLIDRHVDLLHAILRRTLVDLSTVANKNELSGLRELAERTAWFEQRISHQLDRVRVVTDQSHMTAMDDLNDTMYRLTLIATVFLPLTFITGLLGINVGGIPGAEDRSAFWIVCGGLGGLAIVTLVILARILRNR